VEKRLRAEMGDAAYEWKMEQEQAKLDGGLGPEAPESDSTNLASTIGTPPLSYWRTVAPLQSSLFVDHRAQVLHKEASALRRLVTPR
jgi:hypothetical protein